MTDTRSTRYRRYTLNWIERFHAAVDDVAGPIAELHAKRLQCRAGCSACCTDGITVFEIEADRIVARHQDLLENGEPHAEGGCAFLDGAGRCRIYEERPYVCRTQGLPLRWIEEDEDGAAYEARDICPLNDEGGPPLEELEADAIWTIGPFEDRLAAQQRAVDGGEGRRVGLRELFANSPGLDAARRRLPVIR
jgi:Fe-S-cluster containining protein